MQRRYFLLGAASLSTLSSQAQGKPIRLIVPYAPGGPLDITARTLAERVQAQMQTMPQLKYVPVVSNAEAEDQWQGRTGFVDQAVLQDHPDLSGHQVYACGAPIVVESAQRDYVQLGGLPSDEFYADAFTSEADKAQA